MRPTTRDRLFLPIVLPIAILGGIALILWGFSRILLGIEGSAATAVAIIVAASIMVVSAIAVSRPQVRASTIAAVLGTTAGVAMLAGGIAIAVVAGGEEEPGGGEPPGGAVVNLVAQNIAFSPANLSVPAGQPFTIAFDNRDPGTQHNVEIFDNQELSGTPLFSGDLVTGPAKATYDVGPLDAGTYYFRCVVHPNMTGQIVAAGGGGGGGGGGAGASRSPRRTSRSTPTASSSRPTRPRRSPSTTGTPGRSTTSRSTRTRASASSCSRGSW